MVFMINWKSYASQVGKRYGYVNNAYDISRIWQDWVRIVRNGYDNLVYADKPQSDYPMAPRCFRFRFLDR
jgi:hypothetical protein